MKINKQSRWLAHFYIQVSMQIRKNGKITLPELERLFKKHSDMVYSWMQWSDAKQWFMACGGNPIEYRMRHHLQGAPQPEINEMIKQYYKV